MNPKFLVLKCTINSFTHNNSIVKLIVDCIRAGEVREVGPKVTRVKEGDMVMALLASGGYAECNAYQNNNYYYYQQQQQQQQH
jgi:threonine dehydrogenase-like Zn-dependent dehydrogenase